MKNLFVDADHAEILRRFQALRPDATRLWGTMNVTEMLCHLSDAFRTALGERPIHAKFGWKHHTLFKWLMLFFPPPKGVPTVREYDARRDGTRPTSFEEDRRTLLALTERFCAAADTLDVHPIFGKLKRWQWGRWAYTHMDHHLRQFGV